MKILYGVQATGNGHISRSRIMAKYFAESDVDVTYLFSGRPANQLFDMEIFGGYFYRQGLTFVSKAGKVNYLASAYRNNIVRFIYDVYSLNLDEFDLVITDFEPVTAWAAKLKKKPVLGIGHQYAFGENTPITGENIIAKSVMKYFAPANSSLGLHWAPFGDNVLPPIIDVNMKSDKDEDLIVVYLPFEDQQTVTNILNQMPDKRFIQYSSDLTDGEQGNVDLRAASYQGFKNDLCRAGGVICNSGFELVSECLHLGLPILTKPMTGQMEQLSNALALKKLGLAQVMQSLEPITIADWLENRKLIIERPMPDVAKEIVKAVLNVKQIPVKEIADNLWRQYQLD